MNHYCIIIKEKEREKEFTCHLYREEELSEDDIVGIYGLKYGSVEWYSINKLKN